MKNAIQALYVKNSKMGARISLALSAAAMSIVCALFVPYAYPWPSLAWAVLACAAAVWVAQSSGGPTPRMSDVIRDAEAESPRLVTGARRGLGSTKVVL